MYQGVFIKGLNMNHELLMMALGERIVIMFMCFHYASAILRVGRNQRAESHVCEPVHYFSFPWFDIMEY